MGQPTFNPASEFNLIGTANTFADWVATTNQLVQQNNDLAANNFVKGTGTLYLNDPSLALTTNSTVVMGGTSFLNTAVIKTLRTTGDFVLSGNTTYQSNNFLINANSSVNLNGAYSVFRPFGHNASLRWNEAQSSWEVLDVSNDNLATAYSKIVTANQISSSLISTSTSTLATSSTVNTLFSMVTSTSAGASNTFIGTSGTANPVNGVVTMKSNNGVAIVGVANSIYINTQQDLRNTASPTFASLNLTTPLAVAQGGTGANNFLGALNNLLPPTGQISGYVLSTTGTGQYYWGQGGGGGGGSGGNTIATTRRFYSAVDGQSIFTGAPPYTIGSGQLRIYINGVRQYTSEINETSNTSFLLNTPAKGGDSVMAEVDAYTSAFFANNTSYTANTLYLGLGQNTVQLGIDGALGFAKGAFDEANAGFILASSAYISQNSTGNFANAAYSKANAAFVFANTLSSNLSNTVVTSSLVANVSTINTASIIVANITTSNVVTSIVTGTATISTANITGLATMSSVVVTGSTQISGNTSTYGLGVGTPSSGIQGDIAATSATLSGNARIASLGVGTTASGTAGEIRAVNNITAYYSDNNLKTRLGNIENALDKVMTLNGFFYEANETAQALGYVVKREVGVSAQEVQAILPEIVVPAPISDKYLTVHYEKMIPLLIEAIKELKNEVNEIRGLIK